VFEEVIVIKQGNIRCVQGKKITSGFYVFLIAIIFSSCSGIKPVVVKNISNIKSENTFKNPELTFELTVENPNKYNVTISRMNLDLYNGETSLVAINLVEKTKISKFQSVVVPVSMKPSMETINTLLKSELNNLVRGKVNQKMEIRGELVIKKFIFSKKIKLKEAVKF